MKRMIALLFGLVLICGCYGDEKPETPDAGASSTAPADDGTNTTAE